MKKVYSIHGDVTIVRINKLPKGIKKINYTPGFILERGEGVHTHIIKDECSIYEKDGIVYLQVNNGIRLDHEEHGVQILEPGIYRKEMERNFDYEAMEARKVID